MGHHFKFYLSFFLIPLDSYTKIYTKNECCYDVVNKQFLYLQKVIACLNNKNQHRIIFTSNLNPNQLRTTHILYVQIWTHTHTQGETGLIDDEQSLYSIEYKKSSIY